MYWNNPLIETAWPSFGDPVKQSFHSGAHCLFWNPTAKFNYISTNQRLVDLCNWANEWMTQTPEAFLTDPNNHYDIANLVKLNLWIHDIRAQGVVKPWMILDQGDGTYLAGTGDSRLRCLERIPEIATIPAFITTHARRAHLYTDLEPVTTFDQFAQLCNAKLGQEFLFRLTDPAAPYGIYWYEYNSEHTRSVTPSQDQAVAMFAKYLQQHPGTIITPKWFDQLIAWQDYTNE